MIRVTVRENPFNLLFTNRMSKKVLGLCDPPGVEPRTIKIRKSLKGEERLDTIIHELLHAAQWDLSEDAVEETASDIACALWQLGYRGPEDED